MRWGAFLVVSIVMAACAREPAPGPRSSPASIPSLPAPSPGTAGIPGSATAQLPDVHLSLSADPSEPVAGRPVTLTLTVQASRDLTLRFPTGQRYEFEAVGPPGAWRWSEGRFFTQGLGEMALRLGEQLTYRERWVPGAAGHFLLRGRVTAAWRPDLAVEAGIEVST